MGCSRSANMLCPRANRTAPVDCTGCIYYFPEHTSYSYTYSMVKFLYQFTDEELIEELKRRLKK